MNANELRLGNYVWENYGGVYVVRGIPDENNVTISKTKTTVEVNFKKSDIKSIRLTEDWLLHFGFEKDNDFKHPKGPIYFANVREELICFVHNCSHRHINHVHQLQNLFFALTGEELVFKNCQ